ncbi:MAG: hypothetical protein ACI9K3_000794 [Halovenus sp.]|jgi:hypothetical protein
MTEEYTFACPACEAEIAVNGEMRDAIVANGCPVCAVPVGPESFS